MAKQILQDKRAIIHVLAGLMANPEKLKNTREYKISTSDFPERFHKLVFGAIHNLHEQGIEKITPVSIDGQLSTMPSQYLTFNDCGGLDYLYRLEEIGEPSNFDMYYNQVKKYSFLRSCETKGIDIKDIYDTSLIDIKETETQQELFDSMSLDDMMKHIENKLIDIKDDFLSDKDNKGSHMSDNLKAIVQQKMEKPTYGAGLSSGYYNAVTRGARLRKVYLVSGSSGSGKSRFALANMLAICVPEKWNSKTKLWEKTGATGRCLFVSTELEEDEIKIPALCYIADVSEYKLQNAQLDDEEKARLMKAIEVLEITPFWFEELHDFDLADIEHVISKNVTKHGVQYISYDYIHTSMKIFSSMAKAGARNLQEHQILLQMSIRLKELANKYSIFLTTSTQLNNNIKEEGNMDDSSLSGAKSIAQKVDIGAIMIPINKKDEDIIAEIMSKNPGNKETFGLMPTHSINFYKNRGNPWKNVRIFIHFNMDNLQVTDLFVTDYKGNLIPNIKPLDVKFEDIIEDDEVEMASETEQEDYDMLPESFYEEESNAEEGLPNAFPSNQEEKTQKSSYSF